jgi:hypothetical protein
MPGVYRAQGVGGCWTNLGEWESANRCLEKSASNAHPFAASPPVFHFPFVARRAIVSLA